MTDDNIADPLTKLYHGRSIMVTLEACALDLCMNGSSANGSVRMYALEREVHLAFYYVIE